MAVNSPKPVAADLKPVAGIEIGYAEAGIKKPNRKDVLVMTLAPGATVAGVFTLNRFCAAPVQIAKANLAAASANSGAPIKALMINTGNANAGTGELGLALARQSCAALAGLLGCDAAQILPFSTGVILEPLPVEKVVAGLPAAVAKLKADNWFNAAEAIMTTDTQPKAGSRSVTIAGHAVTLTGISKGAGMIRPNMATMLGFLAFDAKVAQPVLDVLVKQVADQSFNCITRWRHLDQRLLHAGRHRCRHAGSELGRLARVRRIGGRRDRAVAVPRASHHPRRRGRDQVHHRHRRRGQERRRVPQDRLLDRPLAVGQDGLLRVGPEPGPHPRGDRLRRRRRPRCRPVEYVSGRRVGGQKRRPQSGLPRRRRPARDAAERDHGARQAGARRGGGHRLHLRPVARLRVDQRRLPLLIWRRHSNSSWCAPKPCCKGWNRYCRKARASPIGSWATLSAGASATAAAPVICRRWRMCRTSH